MFYIAHSAEGSVWEKHKYLKRIDGRYYYPDNYEGGRHLSDLKKKRSRGSVLNKKANTSKALTEKSKKVGNELKREMADSDVTKIAKDIIRGKYGIGNDARRKALGMTAEEYEVVRKKVNEMMRGSSGGTKIASSKSAVKKNTTTSAPTKQKSSTKKEKKKNTAKKSGGLDMNKVYRVYK